MPRTDWIEKVSQANWPATRVRNVVKAIKEHRVSKFGAYQMVPPNAPPKRMTREDGIFWLSQQMRRLPLIEFKLTRPVDFLKKYFLGEHTAERDALVKAIEIVHGTSARGMNMPADAECAPDWMLGLARKQYLVEHTCSCYGLGRKCYCDHAAEADVARADLAAAPAPLPLPAAAAAAPAAEDVNSYVEGYDAPQPAPQFVVVPEVDLGIRLPAPPVPTWAPVEVYPHRTLVNNDADDHLFEPPPVAPPTITEVAERLVLLRERVDAHEQEAFAEQRRFEDRQALNRLSDRLVATEMELGLIDDALDHMHAGQQSTANVVGRLAAIIKRITTMDI